MPNKKSDIVKRVSRGVFDVTIPESYIVKTKGTDDWAVSGSNHFYARIPVKGYGGVYVFFPKNEDKANSFQKNDDLVTLRINYRNFGKFYGQRVRRPFASIDTDTILADIAAERQHQMEALEQNRKETKPVNTYGFDEAWDRASGSVGDGSLHQSIPARKETNSSGKSSVRNRMRRFQPSSIEDMDAICNRIKEPYQKALVGEAIRDYNALVDVVQEHDIFIGNPFDVTRLVAMSDKDIMTTLRTENLYILATVKEFAKERGVEFETPDLGRRPAGVKNDDETFVESVERWNKERHLSIYDEQNKLRTISNRGKTFPGSYNHYAISEHEAELLAKGKSVILSGVDNLSGDGIVNLECKLSPVPVDYDQQPYGESLTYVIVPVRELAMDSLAFMNEDRNERYRSNVSEYSEHILALQMHADLYGAAKENAKNRVQKSGKFKKEVVSIVKELETEAKKVSKSLEKKEKVLMSRDYFLSMWIDSGSGTKGPIPHYRRKELLAETKERLSKELPKDTKKFTTRYDEKRLDVLLKYYKKRFDVIDKVMSQWETEIKKISDVTEKQKMTDRHKIVSKSLTKMKSAYELLKKENDLRNQPADAKYRDMGYANRWEQYVVETYERYEEAKKSSDPSVRRQYNNEMGKKMTQYKTDVERDRELRKLRAQDLNNRIVESKTAEEPLSFDG